MDLFEIMKKISLDDDEVKKILTKYPEEKDTAKKRDLNEQIYKKTFEIYRNYLTLIDAFKKYEPFISGDKFSRKIQDLEASVEKIGGSLEQFDELIDN